MSKKLLAAALAAAFLATGGAVKAADAVWDGDKLIIGSSPGAEVTEPLKISTATGTDTDGDTGGDADLSSDGITDELLTLESITVVTDTGLTIGANEAIDILVTGAITITADTMESATLQIAAGSSLESGDAFTIEGVGDAEVTVGGDWTNSGTVTNQGRIDFEDTGSYSGEGTIDNVNGLMTFAAGTGDIISDITFEDLDSDGFGELWVEGDITKAIDLEDAYDGMLTVSDDGLEQAVISADINLGDGIFFTGYNAEGVLIQGSITAFGSDLAGGTVIDTTSTITGNVAITDADPNSGDPAVTNKGTINLVSADGQTFYDLDWDTTDDVLVNEGTINFGDDSTVTAPGVLDNTDGQVNVTADFTQNGELADLEEALTGTGTGGDIGAFNVKGELTDGFEFTTTDVTDGVVTIEDALKFTSASTTGIDVTGAKLVLKGSNGTTAGESITADQIDIDGDNTIYADLTTTLPVGTDGDGNIYINGDKNTFTGTIDTSANPSSFTSLDDGLTATFAGADLDTDFVAGDGTTLNIGIDGEDAGLTVNNGYSFNADDATIVFTTDDGTNGLNTINNDGTLNLTSDTVLKNYSNEDLDGVTVLNNTGIVTVDGDNSADALTNYLNAQSSLSLYASTVYAMDGDNVILTRALATDPSQNLGAILDAQGIGQFRNMISDSTLTSQYLLTGLYEDETSADYLALSDSERYVVDVTKIASGLTVNGYSLMDGTRANEAYALEQWKNGADWAGSVEAVTDTVRNFNRAITNRAYNIGSLLNAVEYDECGNVISSCGGFKNRLWAGYTGQWDKNDGRGWDKGYKYDAHGFNIGYDHVTSSGVGFGAAFGYSAGDYKSRARIGGEKSDIDNYSFGLFASYNHASGFFTTLSGTYTRSDYKMRNFFSNYGTAGFDRAKYHGNTWSVGGQIGYDIRPVANLTITPTVGLFYYDSSTNRFNSTYRQGMKYSRHDLELPVDVTVKYDIEVGCDSTLSLVATGGYAYNFNNKGTRIHGFGMRSDTNALNGYEWGDSRMTKVGRSSWNVGGGLQYRYKNVDLGVHYEYYGRKDFTSHNLTANVGYSF